MKKQFGYKQQHSTENMIRGMMDKILGFNNNEEAIIIFLNLSAAFDTKYIIT